MKAELLVDAKCILAEGIQWRADQSRLWWTDIHGRALWSCDADGADVTKIETPERLGSFAFDVDGNILAAFETGLFKWDPDGDRLQRLTHFEPDHATSRLNDGRCDRQGRFITGGVDENGLAPTTSVIRYGPAGLEPVRSGVGCTNALCFSPDGAWMYFTDTPTRQILRFPYGDRIGEGEVFHVAPDGDGFPDGACVDAEGALWNARFNGWSVVRIGNDGEELNRIELPVPQVTCACFGGPDLDRLYITTARENMDSEQIDAHPLSGGIFIAEPGVRGLREDRFAEWLFP